MFKLFQEAKQTINNIQSRFVANKDSETNPPPEQEGSSASNVKDYDPALVHLFIGEFLHQLYPHDLLLDNQEKLAEEEEFAYPASKGDHEERINFARTIRDNANINSKAKRNALLLINIVLNDSSIQYKETPKDLEAVISPIARLQEVKAVNKTVVNKTAVDKITVKTLFERLFSEIKLENYQKEPIFIYLKIIQSTMASDQLDDITKYQIWSALSHDEHFIKHCTAYIKDHKKEILSTNILSRFTEEKAIVGFQSLFIDTILRDSQTQIINESNKEFVVNVCNRLFEYYDYEHLYPEVEQLREKLKAQLNEVIGNSQIISLSPLARNKLISTTFVQALDEFHQSCIEISDALEALDIDKRDLGKFDEVVKDIQSMVDLETLNKELYDSTQTQRTSLEKHEEKLQQKRSKLREDKSDVIAVISSSCSNLEAVATSLIKTNNAPSEKSLIELKEKLTHLEQLKINIERQRLDELIHSKNLIEKINEFYEAYQKAETLIGELNEKYTDYIKETQTKIETLKVDISRLKEQLGATIGTDDKTSESYDVQAETHLPTAFTYLKGVADNLENEKAELTEQLQKQEQERERLQIIKDFTERQQAIDNLCSEISSIQNGVSHEVNVKHICQSIEELEPLSYEIVTKRKPALEEEQKALQSSLTVLRDELVSQQSELSANKQKLQWEIKSLVGNNRNFSIDGKIPYNELTLYQLWNVIPGDFSQKCDIKSPNDLEVELIKLMEGGKSDAQSSTGDQNDLATTVKALTRLKRDVEDRKQKYYDAINSDKTFESVKSDVLNKQRQIQSEKERLPKVASSSFKKLQIKNKIVCAFKNIFTSHKKTESKVDKIYRIAGNLLDAKVNLSDKNIKDEITKQASFLSRVGLSFLSISQKNKADMIKERWLAAVKLSIASERIERCARTQEANPGSKESQISIENLKTESRSLHSAINEFSQKAKALEQPVSGISMVDNHLRELQLKSQKFFINNDESIYVKAAKEIAEVDGTIKSLKHDIEELEQTHIMPRAILSKICQAEAQAENRTNEASKPLAAATRATIAQQARNNESMARSNGKDSITQDPQDTQTHTH